jgi:PncC family amidohydrolase
MTNSQNRLDTLEELIYSKVLDLIRLLRESNRRIVLAESCTGGMISSWFVSVPGVSDVFCGSMVVYRNDTKSKWLGLAPSELADPQIGSVSASTSENLARRVVLLTPEADFGLGITGHLGPATPEPLSHRIFLVWARRQMDFLSPICTHRQLHLETSYEEDRSAIRSAHQTDSNSISMLCRRRLQLTATLGALDFAAQMLCQTD